MTTYKGPERRASSVDEVARTKIGSHEAECERRYIETTDAMGRVLDKLDTIDVRIQGLEIRNATTDGSRAATSGLWHSFGGPSVIAVLVSGVMAWVIQMFTKHP